MLCVEKAHDFRVRLIGLLGRYRYPSHHVLWLQPCSVVHTFGMRFALDLVFLDQYGRVLKTVWELAPSRVCGCRGAISVLESQASAKSRLRRIKVGDCLSEFTR